MNKKQMAAKLMDSCHKEDVMGFTTNLSKELEKRVVAQVKTRLFKEEAEEDEVEAILGTGRCPKCKEGCAVVDMGDGKPVSNCCDASMANVEWQREE